MNTNVGSSGFGGGWNSSAHGTAKWLQPEEAQRLDLFAYYPNSIILGQNSQGQLACYNRQGHVLVMAPPRSGKGIGFVQANLIGYQGSMIVTDPKGENAAVTYRHRKSSLGQNVVILDPTNKLASYEPDTPIPTHRFNPLSVFANSSYEQVVDDIERIADALLVPQSDPREQHWRDGARNYLKSMLTYLVFYLPPEKHDLIMLSRLASGLEVDQEDVFLALVHNAHPDHVMQDIIAQAGAWWSRVNPKERSSFVSYALRSLAWLNSPIWRKHLTASDFHPYDLKSGKTTVYIVCPFDKLKDYSPWFRLVLSSCLVAIMRAPNRSQIPTLFMLDEYAATIGRLDILEHCIPFIEGVGARFAFVFQYLTQMSTELWPNEQYHGIFASAGVHVFFNVGDQATAKYVSDYMGKYGAMAPSTGGMSMVQRDLLTPDEVRYHPEHDMIAFVRGYRPAWLGKLDIRRHTAFQGRHDPNPAYKVLPDRKPAIEGAGARSLSGSGATLNAADAIARAKGTVDLTMSRAAAAINAKFPDKKMRAEGDLYGYDDAWINPETGHRETFFVGVIHMSLLRMLDA